MWANKRKWFLAKCDRSVSLYRTQMHTYIVNVCTPTKATSQSQLKHITCREIIYLEDKVFNAFIMFIMFIMKSQIVWILAWKLCSSEHGWMRFFFLPFCSQWIAKVCVLFDDSNEKFEYVHWTSLRVQPCLSLSVRCASLTESFPRHPAKVEINGKFSISSFYHISNSRDVMNSTGEHTQRVPIICMLKAWLLRSDDYFSIFVFSNILPFLTLIICSLLRRFSARNPIKYFISASVVLNLPHLKDYQDVGVGLRPRTLHNFSVRCTHTGQT